MRRLKPEDFEGKTIIKADVESCNYVTLTCSDGTVIKLWTENGITPGFIPGIFIDDE